MKQFLVALSFFLAFGISSLAQEMTYIVCPGDSVLVDLQSLHTDHSSIQNIVWPAANDLNLFYPIGEYEFAGEPIPADSTAVYATPNSSGVYSFSYDYLDEQGAAQSHNGSVEMVIDSACSSQFPCYEIQDNEQSMPVSTAYAKVALGDMTGDGAIDAVVGTRSGYMVCNNLSGIFFESITPIEEYNPTNDILLHDFNGDGWMDMVLAKSEDALTPSNIRLSNDGISWTDIDFSFPAARDVLIADINGDDFADLLFSGTVQGSTLLYIYDSVIEDFTLTQTINNQGQLNSGDFDGDGDIDIVLSATFEENFSSPFTPVNASPTLLLNDAGVLSGIPILDFTETLDVVDLNADGLPDIVAMMDGPNEIWMNQQGSFTFLQTFGNANTVDLASADMDGDGDLDLVTCNKTGTGSRENKIWFNEGDGSFSGTSIPVGYHSSYSIAVDELNGLGLPDVFTTSVNGPGKIYFVDNFDFDADGICNAEDNCPETPNALQLDANEDGVGDVCDEGDVYPGDCNNDGVANNYDILNIGVAYGSTGPARENGTTNWVGQVSANWEDVFANGLNQKYADCDGNGVVEQQDVDAIKDNYGQTHGKDEWEDEVEDGVPFFVANTNDVSLGQPFSLPIILGTPESVAQNVYALAFSINLNLDYIVDETLALSFNESWLGTENDLIFVFKEIVGENRVEIGVSRKNHLALNGQGILARLVGVVEPNIEGKVEIEVEAGFSITNYEIINERSEVLEVEGLETTILISGSSSVGGIQENSKLLVFPNPCSDMLNISTPNKNSKIVVTNTLGINVFESNTVEGELKIATQGWNKGIYFVSFWKGNVREIRKIKIL